MKSQKEEKKYKIMVTGGGSGGHIAASKSVINYMIDSLGFSKEDFVYLGGRYAMEGERGVKSLEERTFAPLGFRFISINGGKLHRYLTLDLIRQFFLFLAGFWDSFWKLKREKPEILFSTGGFVTVPPIIIAKLLNIPVVIHEQTVVSGLANRIAAKFADKVCISHESSKNFFPRTKTILTGNPINKAIFVKDIEDVDTTKEFKDKFRHILRQRNKYPLLFLTGGGQGALQLNIIFRDNLAELLDKYSLILQVGDNRVHQDYEKFQAKAQSLTKEQKDRFILLKFFKDEVGPILNNADIIVTRGGANTLGEIEAVNKKAMVVALDGVSGDEQFRNAERLVSKDLAIVYRQKKFNSGKLWEGLEKMKKLKPVKRAQIPRLDAEKRISEVVLSYLQ